MLAAIAMGLFVQEPAHPAPDGRAEIAVAGPWTVTVTPGKYGWWFQSAPPRRTRRPVPTKPVELQVQPAALVKFTDEKHDSLPLFDASAAPWIKGARLVGVITSETTAPDILVPESVVVKSGPGNAQAYVRGRDYDMDLQWGTFGRLPGGIPEGAPVYVDYEIGLHRIDTIATDASGDLRLFTGTPHNATPKPPTLPEGWTAVANLWVPARLKALGPDNLFPIIEPTYKPPRRTRPPAATLLPRT